MENVVDLVERKMKRLSDQQLIAEIIGCGMVMNTMAGSSPLPGLMAEERKWFTEVFKEGARRFEDPEMVENCQRAVKLLGFFPEYDPSAPGID